LQFEPIPWGVVHICADEVERHETSKGPHYYATELLGRPVYSNGRACPCHVGLPLSCSCNTMTGTPIPPVYQHLGAAYIPGTGGCGYLW